MKTKLRFQDSSELTQASFVKGDFIWQPLSEEGPKLFRFCPSNQQYNAEKVQCEACKVG